MAIIYIRGMSGYEKGQIYKVVDVGFNLCYIGSTTEKLVKRFARHRRHYRAYLSGKRGKLTLFDILMNMDLKTVIYIGLKITLVMLKKNLKQEKVSISKTQSA